MNKILLPFVILLSAYLAFTSLTSTDEEKPVVAKNLPIVESQKPVIPTMTVDENNPVKGFLLNTEQYSFEFGTYSGSISTDTLEANISVTLNEDGTYRHSRFMKKPTPNLNGMVEGQYKVEGNYISVLFPEDRDLSIFSSKQAEFKVEKNGTLTTGGYVLTRE